MSKEIDALLAVHSFRDVRVGGYQLFVDNVGSSLSGVWGDDDSAVEEGGYLWDGRESSLCGEALQRLWDPTWPPDKWACAQAVSIDHCGSLSWVYVERCI